MKRILAMADIADVNSKERVLWPDALRVLAIICVVSLHICQQYWDFNDVGTVQWQVVNFVNCLVGWGVPIFLMLSGMFNLSRPAKGSPSEELRDTGRRCLRLIIPLVVWSLFYLIAIPVLDYCTGAAEWGGFAALIVSFKTLVIGGPSYYHFWYLYLLLGFYLITPLLRIFIAHVSKQLLEYYLILAAICMGISFLNNINPFLDEALAYFPTGNIYWPLSGVFDYLSYYVAGYYFGTYALKRRTRVILYLSGFACFVIRLVITSQWSLMEQQLMLQYAGGAILPSALIALAVFLLVKQRFENRPSKSVATIAQPLCDCAFGVYLVHVFVLTVLLRLWSSWSDMLPAYGIPLMIVIVFAVSMLLTLLLRLVPVIGKRIT